MKSTQNELPISAIHPALLEAISDRGVEAVKGSTGFSGFAEPSWALGLCLVGSAVLAIGFDQGRAIYFIAALAVLAILLGLNGGRRSRKKEETVCSSQIQKVLESSRFNERLMQSYGEALLALLSCQIDSREAEDLARQLYVLMDAGQKVEKSQKLMRRALIGIADAETLEEEHAHAQEKLRLSKDELARKTWSETVQALSKRVDIRKSYNTQAERLDAQYELLVQRLRTYKDLLVRSTISPSVDLQTAFLDTSASVKDLISDIDANERAVLELIS